MLLDLALPPDFAVVGEAAAFDPARELSLDSPRATTDVFIVADSDQLPGLAAALADDRHQSVVVLSNDGRAIDALRSLPLRGWSVVPANATPEELRTAVRSAALGWASVPARVLDAAIDGWRSSASGRGEPQALDQPLTAREIEVLERVSRGLPSKLIARELEVSESTIKFHLSSVYAKLGVASRTEAVSRAARLGLITL
jgi:DNA-binding NarL/FixJ family response regulator